MNQQPTQILFTKMHGAGNDYVYIDGIGQNYSIDLTGSLAEQLADRNKGIGGDGLILLAHSETADCRMVMWNADGSRGAMCGNGVRCLAKFAFDLGHVRSTQLTVETDSGTKVVDLIRNESGTVTGARVDMGKVTVELEPTSIEFEGRTWQYYPGDAGNPHAVIFVDEDPRDVPVDQVGVAMQEVAAFPDGVNVEFIQVCSPTAITQRTFERGSGETLACGSGATVAALCAMRTGRVPGPTVTVHLLGGDLQISDRDGAVVMEGPATTVFTGKISV